jgi:hypothetical protein
VSIFSDALGTILNEIHRAQGEKTIVYTCANQAPVTIAAVFDEDYQATDLTTGEISDLGPVLGLRVSDLPAAPAVGDAVSIAGVAYSVADVRPDGEGGAVLPLHEA